MASTVFSSTIVPVYPCTAARVTIERVSNIITANRLTDSAEPEPLRPLFTSFRRGVLPNMSCMICGPLAPILPSSRAPPIHRANGPKIPISPSTKKLETIPSSLPFISSQVSTTASIPNRNAVQCNQRFGSDFLVVFFTPSSISSSMKSRARLRPNRTASPRVVTAVKRVDQIPRVGFTSKSPVLNSINPTADNTSGTANNASMYPINHATEAITNNSSSTIPWRVFPSAPITR